MTDDKPLSHEELTEIEETYESTETDPNHKLVVLRLARNLREARKTIAFTVRTLDKSRGAKKNHTNPLEVISDQARAEKMLRAFLGGPSGEAP